MGTRLCLLTQDKPKALLEIGDQPVLVWQLLALRRRGVGEVTIVASPSGLQPIRRTIEAAFGDTALSVQYVVQDRPLGPGHALALAAKRLASLADSVTVLLSDTLVQLPENLDGDWIGVAPAPAGTTSEWCMVDVDQSGFVRDYHDQPTVGLKTPWAAVGVYGIASPKAMAVCVSEASLARDHGPSVQLSTVFSIYGAGRAPFRAERVAGWQDIGTVERYQAVARASVVSRRFNELTVVPGGYIDKTSSATEIIDDEAAWMERAPKSALKLAPRFLGRLTQGEGYRREFLDYPTLASRLLYQRGPLASWSSVATSLIEAMLDHVWIPVDIDESAFESAMKRMYLEKTTSRLVQWDRRDLLARSELTVNGRHLGSFAGLWEATEASVESLTHHSAGEATFIHGDPCFSNILMSERLGIFRLIDPRGRFGGLPYAVGDRRYDLAKMRHSYHGQYEAIVRDLFEVVDTADGNIVFETFPDTTVPTSAFDAAIHTLCGTRLIDVELIEALLFLSMIPLHEGRSDMQLAFFARGCEVLARAVEQVT